MNSLERFDSGVSQQVDFQIRLGLKQFAALVADARSRCPLSVDFAQVTSQSGPRRKHGWTGFAWMMRPSAAAGQAAANIGAIICIYNNIGKVKETGVASSGVIAWRCVEKEGRKKKSHLVCERGRPFY